jgi:D-3-phosphoglycerate dehydrogenase / 2-oxoglutarate reductase
VSGQTLPKIAISTSTFGQFDAEPIERCRKRGYTVLLNPLGRTLTREEIIEFASGAAGLVAGTEPLTSEVLESLPDLKVVSRCGTGLENVDMPAAKALGIKVFNTPDAPTLAVAELTVGLILNLLRRITRMDAAVKNGTWQKLMGSLLSGKRVGIIGLGKIGRKVVRLLAPLGCDVAYTDPAVDEPGLKRLALAELLAESDIISVHASTRERILGPQELRAMKHGAYLVNVARGEALDEEALCECLIDGHLAGAALDVFRREPYSGPLKDVENVILTPHIGSYAREARIEMEKQAVENLLRGLEEEA